MVTCPFLSGEKLAAHLPAHIATLADSIYFSSFLSHLPNFHLSAGKALAGVRSASDTPKGVLPLIALP